MRLRARAEHRGARWRAWCPPTVLGASRLRGRARDLLLRHPERGILRPRLLRHVAHRRIEPEAVRLLAEEPLRRELLQRCALLGREPLRGLVVRRPHVVVMSVRLYGRAHEEDRPGGARDELVHPVARLRLRALRRHAVRLRRRFKIRTMSRPNVEGRYLPEPLLRDVGERADGQVGPRDRLHDLTIGAFPDVAKQRVDRESTHLNSSHSQISYAVFCLTKTI